VGAGGGVDSRDAVAKPTGTYSQRPPPDTTRPGKRKTQVLLGIHQGAKGIQGIMRPARPIVESRLLVITLILTLI
jgi:hypothetical protein